MVKRTGPTNPVTKELVVTLRKTKTPVWKKVSEILEKPRRNITEMNISRLSRTANKGDNVVVPGKVLGSGKIDFPVTIAALSFSSTAKEKITEAGGKCLTLEEMSKKTPKGLRLMK